MGSRTHAPKSRETNCVEIIFGRETLKGSIKTVSLKSWKTLLSHINIILQIKPRKTLFWW